MISRILVLFLALGLFAGCNQSQPESESAKQTQENPPKPRYSSENIHSLTGLKVPANLSAIASRTNRVALQVTQEAKTSTDLSLKTTIEHADFCDPKVSTVDFRKLNYVSPVKDQGECGACWAFATNAVAESSYLALRNEKISASEQELISCSSFGSCEGGWWAFDFWLKPGIESDGAYPYQHADAACKTPLNVEFRALRSGYVAQPGHEYSIPSNDELKSAMCKHGPLATGFDATPAFISFGYDHHNQGAIFNENDPGEVNHGITLVGWDDAKQTWIIKNSWNTSWGDDGFLYVRYGANKIGFGAAWAEAWPKNYVPTINMRKLLDRAVANQLKKDLEAH